MNWITLEYCGGQMHLSIEIGNCDSEVVFVSRKQDAFKDNAIIVLSPTLRQSLKDNGGLLCLETTLLSVTDTFRYMKRSTSTNFCRRLSVE